MDSGPAGKIGGAAAPAVVTKVGAAAGVGVHNPLMKHGGYPLVDGVVTAFESVGVVKLASLTVPLAEALCEATGTCAVVHEAIALASGVRPRPFIDFVGVSSSAAPASPSPR